MPRLLLAILLLHYSSAEAANPIESLFTQVLEVFNEENSSERCDESAEDQNFPCLPSLINDISEKAENLPANSLPTLGVGGGSPPNSYTRRDAMGEVLVEDWYTDVPWHQKLSTKDANLIDTPFVLPFAVIPENLCPSADSPVAKSRCMLRYGIVNVMSMRRTDTLYNRGEAPTEDDCLNDDCVEVKFKVQRFNTLTDNEPGYQADEIRNNRYIHTKPIPPAKKPSAVPSLGFAITESTIFAPWRPWYTGHYCAKRKDHVADSVCYEDYFTTQLVAPADPAAEEVWLRDAPAVFIPSGKEPDFTKFCASGVDACDFYLGKVDWKKYAWLPQVSDCGLDPILTCRAEIIAKTLNLDLQFNEAIAFFPDNGRYPWNGEQKKWYEMPFDEQKNLSYNPFIGFYDLKRYSRDGGGEPRASLFKGTHYVLPKQCTKDNFLGARQGILDDIEQMADCALNFEIHSSGFHEQWKELWGGEELNDDHKYEISKILLGIDANQYGRTMFMYAGVPEQHIAVSFELLDDGLSIHDKTYNSSIYTQYLPMVNPADLTLATKSYTDAIWHSFFMSNHMNQNPDHFIRGLRGKTLWHNEFRSNIMYIAAVYRKNDLIGTAFEGILDHVDFPAGFQTENATAPYHGNTCDSCHIRNGGGIPLMPNGLLPQIHVARGMNENFIIHPDYTYSNKPPLPSMKMALFDLPYKSKEPDSCGGNEAPQSDPVALASKQVYSNKIMNFFGDSFHVNQINKQNQTMRLPFYAMSYKPISADDGFEIVDSTLRGDAPHFTPQRASHFTPQRVAIEHIQIGSSIVCQEVSTDKPDSVDDENWPKTCDDVNGPKIEQAIKDHKIGFMHLLGRRLGNTPMIEMIPDQTILATQQMQAADMTYAGSYLLAPGTRSGSNGQTHYRSCTSGKVGDQSDDCYISRWGWIGDRASLEDQIANAAHVEMNVTSKEGYNKFHKNEATDKHLVRYDETLCGPADKSCQESDANSDMTEQEIKDMATYQRWIGIPNRSEYQVSSDKVQMGEKIFKQLHCNSCHVIKKIAFVEHDNMLPDEERAHLKKLQNPAAVQPDYPFISYLGTDLLKHDMGYLSQIAKAPDNVIIRNADGTIKNECRAYVQKIRTPALKGLRFNRFVTDSNHNTTAPLDAPRPGDKDSKPGDNYKDGGTIIPGCDFLLHDGRACDAIQAAYLHDGPAIKKLGIIAALNKLSEEELMFLRAFLYSL